MRSLRRFLAFWYDFVVGDDWVVAVGVFVALLIVTWLVHSRVNAWWLMPLAVVGLLAFSLWRAVRKG